jgi:hypothetical protein
MRPAAALLPLLILLAALSPGVGPATAAAPDAAGGTTMTVAVQDDGDARWNVTMRFPLGDENETVAFRDLAAAYENGSARVGPGVATFQSLVRRANESTARSMGVANVQRQGRVLASGEAGALSLRFTWRNFAAIDNDTLVVDDAFPGEWSLAADQELIVRPPPGYLLNTYYPGTGGGVENGTLRWAGPRTFDEDEPHVEYNLVGNGGGDGTTPGSTTPVDEPLTNDPGALAAGALLLASAVLAAYILATRAGGSRDGEDSSVATDGNDAGTGRSPPDPAAGADGKTGAEVRPGGGDSGAAASGAEPEPEAGAGAGAEAETANTDAADESAGESGSESEPEPEPELLSDEERVERMLRERGGRMKQARIVEETGWSNAKVSQLLSGMAEDERVEKLRIGRENLISLPDAGEPGEPGQNGDAG